MDSKKIGELLKQNPISKVGFNGSGLPLGDDGGYDVLPPDEDLDNEGGHDPLVEVTSLPTHSLYHEMGFTEDPRIFLRKPALHHFEELDATLCRFFGWRLQLYDCFRPWGVQKKNHMWAVDEVARTEYNVSAEDIRTMVRQLLEDKLQLADQQRVVELVSKAARLASTVDLQSKSRPPGFPDHVPTVVIVSAANLGILEIPLDPYSQTPHSTGGVSDCRPIDANTGKPVFMGVPAETLGMVGAPGFFEPTIQTILKEPMMEADLTSVAKRMQYYREEVRTRPAIKSYFEECGIHVPLFFGNDEYFKETWALAQGNQRGWVAVLGLTGVEVYGLEWWHLDANDARRGVRSQRLLIVSGGPSYAIYRGQPMCAWGNATRLYDRLIAA